MSLSAAERAEVISKFRIHGVDTGSTKVQVALLTARINELQGHFTSHIKDYSSRRGLLKLVGKRRRLLEYLKRKNLQEYRDIIQALNIRK